MGGELPHFIQEILSVIWKNVTEILRIEEEILAMRVVPLHAHIIYRICFNFFQKGKC